MPLKEIFGIGAVAQPPSIVTKKHKSPELKYLSIIVSRPDYNLLSTIIGVEFSALAPVASTPKAVFDHGDSLVVWMKQKEQARERCGTTATQQ